MVLHHFIHILPSPHEKLSDILYYISHFFVKIRLFTTNFHYLKVNRFFKKRQFLSVLDKTNVLFIDISENGFSPFFVDKVDNSVYKYIFRHLRPHFFVDNFDLYTSTKNCVSSTIWVLCALLTNISFHVDNYIFWILHHLRSVGRRLGYVKIKKGVGFSDSLRKFHHPSKYVLLPELGCSLHWYM